MPVLKFRDNDGIVKTVPAIKVFTEEGRPGGSGNTEMNIHYGYTEPTDNAKLWVETSEPDKIIISPKITVDKPTIQSVTALNRYDTQSTRGTPAAQVDGKIYYFGGNSADGSITRFYPETGEQIKLDQVSVYNGEMSTSVAVIGKKIYLCSTSYSYKINVFDTETKTVSELIISNDEWYNGTIAAVGDKLYLFGGRVSSRGSSVILNKSVICYDTSINSNIPISATWPNSGYREFLAVATVGSKIYLFGGDDFGTNYTDTIYIFDTTNNTFTLSNSKLPTGFNKGSAVTVGTDIYVFGGITGATYYSTTYSDSIFKYDTISDTIETLDIKLQKATCGVGHALFGTDIYLFGGIKYDAIDKIAFNSPLNTGELRIQTTMGKNSLCKLMTNPVFETCVEKVFVGNEEGYAEQVNAYLFDYNENEWKLI